MKKPIPSAVARTKPMTERQTEVAEQNKVKSTEQYADQLKNGAPAALFVDKYFKNRKIQPRTLWNYLPYFGLRSVLQDKKVQRMFGITLHPSNQDQHIADFIDLSNLTNFTIFLIGYVRKTYQMASFLPNNWNEQKIHAAVDAFLQTDAGARVQADATTRATRLIWERNAKTFALRLKNSLSHFPKSRKLQEFVTCFNYLDPVRHAVLYPPYLRGALELTVTFFLSFLAKRNALSLDESKELSLAQKIEIALDHAEHAFGPSEGGAEQLAWLRQSAEVVMIELNNCIHQDRTIAADQLCPHFFYASALIKELNGYMTFGPRRQTAPAGRTA